MTERLLNVAVIGVGGIARDHHLPAWQQMPEASLVAIADPSEVALAKVGDEFGIKRRVSDYRDLLDDPAIDLVDICVPSGLHSAVAVAALAAGKHVLCEKPMAASRAGAAAMLEACRASGKKLMIGQHMRFEASMRTLRDWFERHPPGPIYYARGQWLRRRRLPGRDSFTRKELSGGGPLYDLGAHMLDLGWWLMGNPRPVAVSGVTFRHLIERPDLGSEWGTWDPARADVEDFGAGLVRFADGSAFSLETSWLALQPEEEQIRLQLYGTQAGAVWPDNTISGEELRTPWDLQLPSHRGEKGQRLAVWAFARAVIDDTPVPIPPEHSANVVAMLEALYASSKEGREQAVEAFD